MKHKSHLICMIPAALLALWLLTRGGSNGALAGVGLFVLICPLTMGIVMWLLMRQPNMHSSQGDVREHEHTGGPR